MSEEEQKLKAYLDNVTIDKLLNKLKDDDGMTWWVDYQNHYQPGFKKLYDKEIKLLLHYITNLQEENERLKNLYTNEKSHKIDYNYIKMLYTNFDKDIVIDDLVYKSEQCRVLYDSAEKNSIKNYNLQQQKDKAIEYIEKLTTRMNTLNYQISDLTKNNLLNILRGDE